MEGHDERKFEFFLFGKNQEEETEWNSCRERHASHNFVILFLCICLMEA